MKKLNFGCGTKIKEDWDNVDIQKDSKITKSFDFNKFPYPLGDNVYDYILVDNVLEHLDEPDKVILELWRISKKDGRIRIIVPYYSNKRAYNDMQHKHFFNEVCFELLVNPITIIKGSGKFFIDKLKIIPTLSGRFMPEKIRKILSRFINGLYSHIDVKLKVIK